MTLCIGEEAGGPLAGRQVEDDTIGLITDGRTPPVAVGTPTASPVATMGPPFVGIGGIAPMSPGMTNYVELVLEAGEHFAICFVPDAETGMPHFSA
jgi:hypothetical protein